MDRKDREALVKRVVRDLVKEIEYAAEHEAEYIAAFKPRNWVMQISENNGVAYGTYPVILSRGGEFWVGSKPPFGYITVNGYDGLSGGLEKPVGEWEAEGWTITYPPVPGRRQEGANA